MNKPTLACDRVRVRRYTDMHAEIRTWIHTFHLHENAYLVQTKLSNQRL